METALQEIIYQVIVIVVTVVGAFLSTWLNNLRKKVEWEKYGLENDKVERVIANAVDYAEGYGKSYFKKYSKNISSTEKLDFARKYINEIDPSTVEKYGDKLNKMIERKVEQRFGSKDK